MQERLQGWDAVSRMNNTLGDWERGWQGLRFEIFYEIFFLASILESTVQSWAQNVSVKLLTVIFCQATDFVEQKQQAQKVTFHSSILCV